MHEVVLNELMKWIASNREIIDTSLVADLGGRNFNGCTRDHIKHTVTFDIKKDPSVDVVIVPGVIPDMHRNKYGIVTSTNSYEFFERVEDFKNEVLDLLAPKGLFFMCSCSLKCPYIHGLNDADKYRQYRKVTVGDVVGLMGRYFDHIVIDVGSDIVFYGKLL